MITNETRAKLIGWETTDGERPYIWRRPGGELVQYPPSYDTDANAVAELRAFVRARGKGGEFMEALAWAMFDMSGRKELHEDFALLDATPQQQTAAFDTVFKDELERINDKQS